MANKRNKRNQQNKKRPINTNSQKTRGYSSGGAVGELRRSRAPRADHKRSITQAGGYPEVITLEQHYDMANHQGIGKNLAYGIVDDTWKVAPTIFDGDKDEERRLSNPTEFEKAIDETFERLDVWNRLKALDIAQRPMRYGALMYVTSEQEGATTKDKLKAPSIEYLEKINVFHEAQLPVQTANNNINSIDFGMPVNYEVRVNVAGSTNEWETTGYTVDASRVYAFGEGALDGSIYGVPCNEGCFEALMDIRKIRMSAAEGLAQNSSNKYAVHFEKGATQSEVEMTLDQMEDLDNELGKSIAVAGGKVSMLQADLSDPTSPWTIALNECAASHSKPMTIIIGAQTGERASGEDLKSWNNVVSDRCNSVGTEMITGFIKSIQERFNFPQPTGKMEIVWRDFNEMTTEQKVDLNLKRSQTNKTLRDAGMLPVYPVDYMQLEAGVPVEDVITLDSGGETVDDVEE